MEKFVKQLKEKKKETLGNALMQEEDVNRDEQEQKISKKGVEAIEKIKTGKACREGGTA